ncbi:Cse1 family protein [Cryptosporidium meleagridis]|uniref:Cse1 family protein n=1 Tax=Cryptosporidium meleagridis TaxID=93969 RepID=A0A2P4YXL3_9CRYT|nr:Cse1 family protein [Cryptosporidium meleagridis]
MEEIVTLLGLSTSINPADVKMAENSLNMKEGVPGFIETLLMIVTKTDIELHIRQVGCIYMKNLVKRKWDIDWEHGGMNKHDRDIIKGNIVNVYMNTPKMIQSQIGEMLLYISVRDFPVYWNDLLVTIVKFLPDEQTDLLSNNGMFLGSDLNALVSRLQQYESTLSMIKLILDKYRYAESSNKVLLELKEILKVVCEPMYRMFVYSSQCLLRRLPVIQDNTSRQLVMNICLLSCQLFYILHCCDIPEFFEDRIGPFMESFQAILELDTTHGLVDSEDQLIICLNIKSQIFENLRIYSDRYQEPFDIYARKSLSTVAILLTKMVSQNNTLDTNPELSSSISSLIDEGLRLIGSLAATQWSDNAFMDSGVLDHLVEKILIPCTFLDINDLNIIEETPKDFVYKYLWDINDVCDSTSKRSAALECIKNLGKFYYTKLSELLSNLIISLLNGISNDAHGNSSIFDWEEFNEKSGNYYKYQITKSDVTREASVFLFICLSVRSFSRIGGVAYLENGIDIVGFYDNYIKSFTTSPLMRCCALKYLIVFKSHFNSASSLDVLQQSYNWLSTQTSSIEEMMILLAFERILTQKTTSSTGNLSIQGGGICANTGVCTSNDSSNSGGALLKVQSGMGTQETVFKLSPTDTYNLCFQMIGNILHPMLKKAFQGEKRTYLTESEFIPRCMMRLLTYLGKLGSELVNTLAPTIAECTKLAVENPKNPSFNHYLFELLGVCIRNSSDCEKLDNFILPILIEILEKNLTDFIPYSLQLLALRLDTLASRNELYDKLFIHLIDAKIWHGPASAVPGIVRLCSSFFKRHSLFEASISSHIKQVFERFQFCLSHRRFQSTLSFEFLRDIVRFLPFKWYSQYLTALANLLLTKSQEWNRIGDHQTIIQVVGAFSIIVIKKPFGEMPEASLLNVLDTLQNGLSFIFFSKVVFPNLLKATLSPPLRYTIFIALLKLVSELTFEQSKRNDFVLEAFKSVYLLFNAIKLSDDPNFQRRNSISSDPSGVSDDSAQNNYLAVLPDSNLDSQNPIQDEFEINYHKLLTASCYSSNNPYPTHKEILQILTSAPSSTGVGANSAHACNFIECIRNLEQLKLMKITFQPYLSEISNHFVGDQNIQSFINSLK